jgi:hypothetical protein
MPLMIWGISGCGSADNSFYASGNSVNQTNSTALSGAAVPLIGGGTFSLEEALQTSPVMMWFWAPG